VVKNAVNYPGLTNQPDQGTSRWPLVGLIRPFLRAQFGQPRGMVGAIAGRLMARDKSNTERIRWTLSLLDLKPEDRVLEIGFGPGIAVEQASRIASDGFVAGVDHSDVMLRQAVRRNARAIDDGRVALRLASAAQLPQFDGPFDKIFSINSIHFWENPVESLRGLRELLKPSGLIAVTLQPRSRTATDETTRIIGEELVGKLERAGFSRCRLELHAIKPVVVACALGSR
jgi:ubiquinone/menaquinone biosynthesis C-methylase UbiE